MCTDVRQRATTHTIHLEVPLTRLCVLLWRSLLCFSDSSTSVRTRSLWLLNRRTLLMLLATGEVLGSVTSTSRGHAGSIRDLIDRQSIAQAIPWDKMFGCMCYRLTTSLISKDRR